MGEKNIIVDNFPISYEGLFDFNEFYMTLDKWFREKSYDKLEKKNSEVVTKTGRDIELVLKPYKKITDYAKIEFNIRIKVIGMTDVIVKRNNMEMKLNKGKLALTLTSYLVTDYENAWQSKPYFYFIRAVFDKWVYSSQTSKWEGQVSGDTNHLIHALRRFLNTYKY